MSRNKTVLIVDDEVINRTILKEAFDSTYTIIEAANGNEAIDALKHGADDIGAVLLDLLMPVADGFTVLDFMKLTHLDTDIPVVVVTSDDTEFVQKKLKEYKISDILNKPFLPMVISRRTKSLINLYADKRRDIERLRNDNEKLKKENYELKERLKTYEKTLKRIEKNFM